MLQTLKRTSSLCYEITFLTKMKLQAGSSFSVLSQRNALYRAEMETYVVSSVNHSHGGFVCLFLICMSNIWINVKMYVGLVKTAEPFTHWF